MTAEWQVQEASPGYVEVFHEGKWVNTLPTVQEATAWIEEVKGQV